MKKIEAIIRKSKFRAVKEALHQVGVNFFSYWDVTGLGNEKEGHVYRGVSYSTSDIQRRHIAIVVNDNSGTPITGTISSTTIPFDFDYDNNVQGGRVAPSAAQVVVRVLGTDIAVNAEGSSTITRATGLVVSVTAPLERNYLNPI